MVATESNFFSAFLVNEHLPRAANLEDRIAFPDIDRIVTPNAFEVHNVLEVPTDQDIHTTDRGDSDMFSVDLFSRANHTFAQVKPGQFFGLSRQVDVLPILIRNPFQYLTNLLRCVGQLQKCQLRQNDNGFAGSEFLDKSDGWSLELNIETAAND